MTTLRLLALLTVCIGLVLSCDEEKKSNPVPPTAPNLLTATLITTNSITLNWNDRSDNEEGFDLEMGEGGHWHLHTTLGTDVTSYVVDGLAANTQFSFRVFAFNNAGRSESSNEYTVSTQALNPPPAPTNLFATALAPTVVRVEWSDTAPMEVVFLIDRKEGDSEWLRVSEEPDNAEVYTDSTCDPGSLYYYRVGARANNLIAWSADSVEVTTPAVGTPHPPSNLTATVTVGTGVRLNWVDNSLDETEFQIRRNLSGQPFEMLDTVAADVVEYFDTLWTNVGTYNYQIRAANAAGESSWSNFVEARYEYCSDGAVPICLENYWEYDVDPATGSNYHVRRQIRQVDYPGGVDYYLMVEFNGDESDTLFYWRNFGDGLYQDNYPLDAAPAELLLRYPPVPGFWNFAGDSVIVTSSNTTVVVNNITYSGVTIFQRFSRSTEHTIKYYLKPGLIGIIKEEHFDGISLGTRMELTTYYVRN